MLVVRGMGTDPLANNKQRMVTSHDNITLLTIPLFFLVASD